MARFSYTFSLQYAARKVYRYLYAAGYVDFEVEGGDIIPGAWRNEFDAALLKPVVFDKKNVLIPKNVLDILKKYSQSIFTGLLKLSGNGRNYCNI